MGFDPRARLRLQFLREVVMARRFGHDRRIRHPAGRAGLSNKGQTFLVTPPSDIVALRLGLGEPMRCYFLRKNRIEGVTFLKTAPDDELIREAEALFLEWTARQQFDGLEVWACELLSALGRDVAF